MFHEDFELETSFEPGGTLSDAINDPLEPGSNNVFAGLNLPPRGVEDAEAKTTGLLDSLHVILCVFQWI